MSRTLSGYILSVDEVDGVAWVVFEDPYYYGQFQEEVLLSNIDDFGGGVVEGAYIQTDGYGNDSWDGRWDANYLPPWTQEDIESVRVKAAEYAALLGIDA